MKKYPGIIYFIVCLQLLLLATTRFTAWPEMTFWPYLMLNGWLPYQNIAIAHTPLMLAMLALVYKIVGIGLIQLKIFTWAIAAVTTIFVFIFSGADKRQKIAVTSAVAYFVLSFIYQGNGLWFDLMLAPLALLLHKSMTLKRFALSGAIFALMFLTKQTAVWFLPIIVYLIITEKSRIQMALKFIAGFGSIAITFAIVLIILGIPSDFGKWAIEFGIFTLPRLQGQISPPAVRQIAYSLLPFSILLFSRKRNLLLWAIAGAMGAFPRFELFHFQPAIPFIALALGDASSVKQFKHAINLYIFIILIMFAYSFLKDFNQPARFFDDETLAFSKYLDTKTEDYSSVFIVNDWDQIYALSHTLPASDPFVPHLPWYMNDSVQEEIVNDLKRSQPEYVVHRPFENSGLSSFRPPIIMNYIYSRYKESGTINGRVILQRQ